MPTLAPPAAVIPDSDRFRSERFRTCTGIPSSASSSSTWSFSGFAGAHSFCFGAFSSMRKFSSSSTGGLCWSVRERGGGAPSRPPYFNSTSRRDDLPRPHLLVGKHASVSAPHRLHEAIYPSSTPRGVRLPRVLRQDHQRRRLHAAPDG